MVTVDVRKVSSTSGGKVLRGLWNYLVAAVPSLEANPAGALRSNTGRGPTLKRSNLHAAGPFSSTPSSCSNKV